MRFLYTLFYIIVFGSLFTILLSSFHYTDSADQNILDEDTLRQVSSTVNSWGFKITPKMLEEIAKEVDESSSVEMSKNKK